MGTERTAVRLVRSRRGVITAHRTETEPARSRPKTGELRHSKVADGMGALQRQVFVKPKVKQPGVTKGWFLVPK